MDNVFLFYHNNNLKAIFNDSKTMKEKTFHHILDFYVEKHNYTSKKEAGHKLKEKIKMLYRDNFNFLEAHSSVWSIVKVNINQINDIIKSNSYQTIYTKLTIKGKNCNKKDLYRDLAYLELDSLYHKK